MKKFIRVLGVTLSLVVLASCSKDDDQGVNPSEEVTETNLKGVYTYQAVNVQTAVDLNKDGIFNNDLFKEGYKTCTLDNQLEITEMNYSFIMKGTSCGVDEKNLIFTYKLDKVEKTITLFENGNEAGKISGIEFKNELGIKTYAYKVFDANLNQDVVFIMNGL